ncbi:hypothetical protein R1sor_025696 [Riccia sorocarpa]|uniref:4-hydroxybenzoate polyprenyltransferase, mitochondrial n=1 Tax=Riccia sorocarpa TaxID=122646 RepID=A0ABD3G9B8_9MARC
MKAAAGAGDSLRRRIFTAQVGLSSEQDIQIPAHRSRICFFSSPSPIVHIAKEDQSNRSCVSVTKDKLMCHLVRRQSVNGSGFRTRSYNHLYSFGLISSDGKWPTRQYSTSAAPPAQNHFSKRKFPSSKAERRLICSSATAKEEVNGCVLENVENPDSAGRTNPGTWIDKCLPRSLHPFAHLARLDKPIGTWLLAWPCFWSVCLAAPIGSLPDPLIICSFGVSALFLRGAACTVNDVFDRDIDRMVERTRNRPLASGALTSFQAVSFFALQLLLGTAFLPQLNNISRILGAIWIPLITAYPLMKRWTYWPQAFLGVMWSYGALFGWAAVHGGLDLSVVLPLYASGMSWTLVYDTIYAHQDKEDDQKIGVKSTALKFGDKTKTWLGWPFYAGVVASACHLAWQVKTVDTDNPADCSSKFASNKWFGAIVCGGIIAGKLMTHRS